MTHAPILEFADSELQAAAWEGDTLCLSLSAAKVDVGGVPGYLSGVTLRFGNARCSGPSADCLGALSEGELRIAGQRLLRLPVPWHSPGPLAGRLRFRNGAELTLQAQTLSVGCSGDARFVESFAC